MLDTKLKNRHKLAVLLIVCTILFPALGVISNYQVWEWQQEDEKESNIRSEITSEEFMGHFVQASYVLYHMEDGRDVEWLRENMSDLMSSYEEIYPYLDYRVLDENEKVVEKSSVDSEGKTLTERNVSEYAIGMVMAYDENGVPSVELKQGDYFAEQSRALRQAISDYTDMTGEEAEETGDKLQSPKDRTYIFAVTEENLQEYFNEWAYDGSETPDNMRTMLIVLFLVVAAAAWIFSLFSSLHTGEEKIFHAPLEIAGTALVCVIMLVICNSGWMVAENGGAAGNIDLFIWVFIFAIVYWGSACICPVYRLGIRRYLKERTLIGLYGKRIALWVKKKGRLCWEKIKGWCSRVYHSLEQIDLSENGTKTIIKIVCINFVILAATCSLWFFGIMALIIYSVILFFLLRKYYLDIQGKYELLLKATGEIAKGNLDVEITDDLGVFNPFKPEIEKIQSGFKKAVKEEVKSQRMKTELITNVSHDLKTPLTAIITYVSLLKDEKDEEKKKEYIDVLERKSLRLKSLIEDLFEISKASSENVTLHIVDVDIVNLFKQVKLEMEEKFEEADIEFRCSYPDEKVIVSLDSQKTYRIFENLLGNIAKYAMPHTRAYVEIRKDEENVTVQIKNISREELNFDP